MNIKSSFICLVFFVGGFLFAQERAIQGSLSSMDEEVNFIILGEFHNQRNFYHKMEFLEFSVFKKDNRLIGLEIPMAFKYVIDDFVNGDDVKIKRFFNYRFLNREYSELKLFLQGLRDVNLLLPEADKLEIFCYDVPHPIDINLTLKAFQYSLGHINRIDELMVSRYFDIGGKIKGQEAKSIADKLVKDFHNNSIHYKEILGSYFAYYRAVINDFSISFYGDKIEFYFDEFMKQREKRLYKRFLDLFNETNSGLVYCGNDHANTKVNDQYSFGNENIDSFASLLKSKFGDTLCSIMIQYHSSNKVKLFAKEFNEFTDKNKLYEEYLSNSENYFFLIDKSQLPNNYPAKERCDKLLLLDLKRVKKLSEY